VPFEPPAAWSEVIARQLDHRSVRSYRPDPVSDNTLTALIAAAQSAPTSGNLQLWSVVAVRDDERRTRLAALEIATELGLPPQDAVLHHEQYDLDLQTARVQTYEAVLNAFYTTAGLPTGWINRVANRFGTIAGLNGREHLRQALHSQGFQLR
jgi:nitroreductase